MDKPEAAWGTPEPIPMEGYTTSGGMVWLGTRPCRPSDIARMKSEYGAHAQPDPLSVVGIYHPRWACAADVYHEAPRETRNGGLGSLAYEMQEIPGESDDCRVTTENILYENAAGEMCDGIPNGFHGRGVYHRRFYDDGSGEYVNVEGVKPDTPIHAELSSTGFVVWDSEHRHYYVAHEEAA